jgi:hypothetical protein
MTSVDLVVVDLRGGSAKAGMISVDFVVTVLIDACVGWKRCPHLHKSLRPFGLAGTRLTRPHCGQVAMLILKHPGLWATSKSESLKRKTAVSIGQGKTHPVHRVCGSQ